MIFKTNAETVLSDGLAAMTKACEALTDQNEQLVEKIASLSAEVEKLKDKVLIEQGERE